MYDRHNRHISSFDAMRLIDGEMSPAEAALAQGHLDDCATCRAILEQTRQSLDELTRIATSYKASMLGHKAVSRLLESKLTGISSDLPKAAWHYTFFRKPVPYLRYALPVFAAAIFLGTISYSYRLHNSSQKMVVLLPDRKLTPGAARPVKISDLCSAADYNDDLDPAVDPPKQMTIFHEYGISPEDSKRDFQVDYLINPQLGGVNDVSNLWPQPYNSEWNAKAKDELERHLHQMVCERKIELADAQHDIAVNWIDAYKKYFHTSKPI